MRSPRWWPFLLACACASSASADFQPSVRVRAREIYRAPSFTLIGGLDYADGRLLFGENNTVKELDPATLAVEVAGQLPPNVSVAFVEKAGSTVYAAVGTSFNYPFPYTFGYLRESGTFSNLAVLDGAYDAAAAADGSLYVVANPGAAGSVIYRQQDPASGLAAVAAPGGFSGGIDLLPGVDPVILYADQAAGRILRIAGGATQVVAAANASYLDHDLLQNTLASVDFGNGLNRYRSSDGSLRDVLAVDDSTGYGIGKFTWNTQRSKLYVTYTDFGAFQSRIYEVLLPFAPGDYSGDGAADPAVAGSFSAAPGSTWWVGGSPASGTGEGVSGFVSLGRRGDIPVSGDFDGDLHADPAVYQRSTGTWLVYFSSTHATGSVQWGWSEAQPVPGDFDGDGTTDFAVYNAASGEWFVRRSSDATLFRLRWGWSEAVPVPGDYTGDGLCDLAVYHPASGNWLIRSSADGSRSVLNWGWSRAKPVAADYDGDGKTDAAVYDPVPGNWYWRSSEDGSGHALQLGTALTRPAPADYDGDGRADPAVFSDLTDQFYIQRSALGFFQLAAPTGVLQRAVSP